MDHSANSSHQLLSSLRRQARLATLGYIVLATGWLTACNTQAAKPPKPPPPDAVLKDLVKPDQLPKPAGLVETGVMRNEKGELQAPWWERTSCTAPNECTVEIVNEKTQEIGAVNGVLKDGWRATGKGGEVAKGDAGQATAKAK